MASIPTSPKIFHITHIDNLERMIRDGFLWSDAKRIEHGMECELVGMSEIKRRRLEELEVSCHQGTKVGEYVPFYFCPRSIMLYILYRGNHSDISYRGGQEPILHLQVDLNAAINWANSNDVPWAFSDRNAGARFANFYNDSDDLTNINWSAIEATVFRDMLIKEGKQAEFLTYKSFPWELVEHIGVSNSRIRDQVIERLGEASSTQVSIERDWYY